MGALGSFVKLQGTEFWILGKKAEYAAKALNDVRSMAKFRHTASWSQTNSVME